MNFVCIVFEQRDEMLTLLSMEKQMVDCNCSVFDNMPAANAMM